MPSMSAAKRRLLIFLLAMQTVLESLKTYVEGEVGMGGVENRYRCRTPSIVRNLSSMLPLKRTALVALLWRYLMTRIKLALMFYFCMVANKVHAEPC